ncbi:MAG: response regulator [Thiohalophilus sp.]|uniref:response regulator n=1 Tax=Thiohalophilus sp. TaxID=3028392 RepID=UPI0028709983|nr:response regulator [Thiohalophilus sp.]MDR9436090.1 response regulator [Thiohalophilus sp.]
MKILVVDDDIQLGRLIKGMFEQLGESQVDCVEEGREGLRRLRQEAYGLVLLDINMPTMSGVDFAVELGQQQPGTPCIFVTAAANEMAQAAMNVAQEAGVRMLGTLHKPFSLEQLETLLQQARSAA